MADPIHQFEIKKILPLELNNIDISFTNSSMFMILAILVTICRSDRRISNESFLEEHFSQIFQNILCFFPQRALFSDFGKVNIFKNV